MLFDSLVPLIAKFFQAQVEIEKSSIILCILRVCFMNAFKTLPFKLSDIVFKLGEVIQLRALETVFATAFNLLFIEPRAPNLHAEENRGELQIKFKKGSERMCRDYTLTSY